MRISEQEIINAICLHMAERKMVSPNQVAVELLWDEELGYSAEVDVSGRSQYLIEANILEAIEQYVFKEYNMRVFRDQLRLGLEDEIYADILD